jgi:hypothetical protein
MGLGNVGSSIDVVPTLPIMMLEIGPESMLPLGSALAAVGRGQIILWQRGSSAWCATMALHHRALAVR